MMTMLMLRKQLCLSFHQPAILIATGRYYSLLEFEIIIEGKEDAVEGNAVT